MRRSLNAVLIGTFTLRFSTGLTGALLVYYLADLEGFGAGREVTAFEAGMLTAAFFLAELILSPLFGMLSDRIGSRPVMQLGPIFGAVAVVMTALTADLLLLGATRWLEGAAAAASIPSILGYIALATSHDEGLRGRTVAQFEAATLAGLGSASWPRARLWTLLDRNAFYLNAVLYGISFLIYRYGVTESRPRSSGCRAPRGRGAGSGRRRRCGPRLQPGALSKAAVEPGGLAAGADLDRRQRHSSAPGPADRLPAGRRASRRASRTSC